MWEKDFDVNTVSEIRTRTSVFFGCGAINKIEDKNWLKELIEYLK